MRTICFLFLLFIIYPGIMFSQSYALNIAQQDQNDNGRLSVNQDERIEELVNRHIRINEKKEGIPGYRIRIFSESGQDARPKATEVRAKFFNLYPDIEAYVDYNPPTWRIYVGDFRSRSEALKVQKEISREYPNSFIISDRINFPSLD